MSLYLSFYYILAIIAFSGFGIIFLNAESILALCFFIFVALIIQNDPVSASLEEQKRTVRSEFISCMLHGEKDFVQSKKTLIYKKVQLLDSLKQVCLPSPNYL
jgi:hypothetical protein